MKAKEKRVGLAIAAALLVSQHVTLAYESPLLADAKVRAQQGDKKAMFSLGLVYDSGRGADIDKSEAARWFIQSADKGYPPAQASLALLYLKGEGVAKNRRRSAELMATALASAESLTPKERQHIAFVHNQLIKERSDQISVEITTEQQAIQRARDKETAEAARELRSEMTATILKSGLFEQATALEGLSLYQLEEHHKTAKRMLGMRSNPLAAREPQPRPLRQYIYQRDRYGSVNPVPVGAIWNGAVLNADRFGNIIPRPVGMIQQNHIFGSDRTGKINPTPWGYVDQTGQVIERDGASDLIVR